MQAGFVDIEGVDDRLGGEQLQVGDVSELFGLQKIAAFGRMIGLDSSLRWNDNIGRNDMGEGSTGIEQFVHALQGFVCRPQLGIGLGFFFQLGQAALDGLQIGQNQLRVDDIDISPRVQVVFYMYNIGVLEGAHHMYDGVADPDVGQELVAESFALAGTGDQSGDIHERNRGGGNLA